MVGAIVVKLKEILKLQKIEIHIQSQMTLLSEDTQQSQHCNGVELHAIHCTSTRFLTTAHFSNECYVSVHNTLQSVACFTIFVVMHKIISIFCIFDFMNFVFIIEFRKF